MGWQGSGFAGAGLRAAEQIAAARRSGMALRLDRRGHAVALAMKRTANGFDDLELGEGADGIHFLSVVPERRHPSLPFFAQRLRDDHFEVGY